MDEDLEGLDDFDETITYRASKKVSKRLEDEAKKRGHKPGPYARYLLEIALGFRKQDPTNQFSHVQPLSKKKRHA